MLPGGARSKYSARSTSGVDKATTLAVTISGRDFARGITHPTIDPGQLTGRGSGTFLHCEPTDRPAPTFAGQTTLHTGGTTPARLLIPVIPAETRDASRGTR